jgi:hyperosmotically inducible periplasmic protein
MTRRVRIVTVLGTALVATQWAGVASAASDTRSTRVENQVRRELVTLPFYSLFDNFTYRIDGETVTLMSKVSRPTLKSDAEEAVKKIEGVEKVVNQIEVLPLSPNDDRLRLALHRAIYSNTALENLLIRAVPPIHIIVENGHVTLEGIVLNEMQKQIAGHAANRVHGVFSVTNNLRMEAKA